MSDPYANQQTAVPAIAGACNAHTPQSHRKASTGTGRESSGSISRSNSSTVPPTPGVPQRTTNPTPAASTEPFHHDKQTLPSPSASQAVDDRISHAQPNGRHRPGSRGRSGSRGSSTRNNDGYLDTLHRLLEHYDLFASSTARFEPLDSFPTNMKNDKRTFILRSKTERGKTDELRKHANLNGVGYTGDRYNYEQKYPVDEPEQACGPNARVWRVYLDEAAQFDLDMVENIRDTVDVILVFAGLFSAIVSALASQVSTALRLDYAQVTAALVMELIAVQRAIATGTSLDTVTPSPLTTDSLDSATSTATDRWVNGLWFTSLAFSLSTALIAVLIKQWIQAYVAPTFGTPRQQAEMRQFRFMGIEQWHVPLIVGLLPTLLHVSLFVFFIGLVTFLLALDQRIAWIVAGIGITAFLAYAITSLLPLWFPQCPYKTPISNYSLVFSQILGRLIYIPPFVRQFPRALVRQSMVIIEGVQTSCSNLATSQLAQSMKNVYRRWCTSDDQIQHSGHHRFTTLKDMESQAVKEEGEKLRAQSFNWLCRISSNPSVQVIVNHAVSELPHETQPSIRNILRQVVLPRICAEVNALRVRHYSVGEGFQIPPPDEAQTLCDLLSAHVTATQSGTSNQHPYDDYHCGCSYALGDIADRLHSAIPRLMEHPLTSFTHVFHPRWGDQTLHPTDIVALRSSSKSKHLWLSILRHQVAVARYHSSLEYSSRWSAHPWKDAQPALSTWWVSVQPIIDVILDPSEATDVFINLEKTLLSAYLCYYTRPAALQPDDHELLEMALWHTDTEPGQWTASDSVHRAVSHYVAQVYLHAVATQPENPGPMISQHVPKENIDVDWNLLKSPRMVDEIHDLPYFLPSPTAFAELIRSGSNHPSPRSDRSQLVILLLDLMRSVMALQALPEVCDAFYDNDCLKVLDLMCDYLIPFGHLGDYGLEATTSITGDYLRVVSESQSDSAAAVWQQAHLDYVFDNIQAIVDRWRWLVFFTERVEMTADIRILVRMQAHRAEWGPIILKLENGNERYYAPQCARLLRTELAKAGRTDQFAAFPHATNTETTLGRARQALKSTASRLQFFSASFRRARPTQPTDVERRT